MVFTLFQDTASVFMYYSVYCKLLLFFHIKSHFQYLVWGTLEKKLTSRRKWLLKWSDGWFDTAINRDDYKFKILVVLVTLLSSLVKLATQFILANNYNPLDPVIWWSKDPGKTNNDKFKCLLMLELVVTNSKHLNFSLFLPK